MLPVQFKPVIVGDEVSAPAEVIRSIQTSLVKIGYSNLKISSLYDDDTKAVFHAFNQHFAPETFSRETMNDEQQIVIRPENNQWYDNSRVRLDKMLTIL